MRKQINQSYYVIQCLENMLTHYMDIHYNMLFLFNKIRRIEEDTYAKYVINININKNNQICAIFLATCWQWYYVD